MSEDATGVVFVDFDGVLLDDAWLLARRAHELSPVLVARLDALCHRTGAAVVVVSGWRCFTSLGDLRDLLARAGLTAPFLGAVGCDRGEDDGRARHAALWLAAHPQVTRWVVLDDEYAWPASWSDRWVRVDGRYGLTEADVERAARVLGRSTG